MKHFLPAPAASAIAAWQNRNRGFGGYIRDPSRTRKQSDASTVLGPGPRDVTVSIHYTNNQTSHFFSNGGS